MKSSLTPENDKSQFATSIHLFDRTEDDFDAIVMLAAQICEAPLAAIAVTVNNYTLFKVAIGFLKTDIEWSVTNARHEPLVIADTLADDRFADSPLLKMVPPVRFYAGIPITTPENFPPAYLCVMDHQPRSITDKQAAGLQLLAKQASSTVKLKSQNLILKKNEEDSRSSEEEMNTIFHNAIDAVIVMDAQGVILQWNPKAEILFGWFADEVIGKPFHQTILPERFHTKHLKLMREYEHDTDEQLLNNNTIEICALRKDSSELDIALGISPATIQGRHFYICFVSDITDRKLVTQQLDKQKEFYENILNKLPTDIAVFDADHKYLFVNPGAISVEEYRKFIVGKDDYQYAEYRNRDISTAHSRRAQFLQVKNTGKEIRWEDSLKDPNGNTITHLRRLFPVHDENAELSMVIGFGIDITDRKIMEEKQAALVKQLSAQNIQLVDFCNIVSHNLRAPLVNMSMLVQFIEETPDPVQQKELISKLNPVIENLNTTFNELVESIQIKQDLEIKSEHLYLKDCMHRTLKVLASEINRSAAMIDTDFDDAPIVYFPPKYLYSIFHNLISNSLKYQSPKRKPIIKLQSKKLDGSILFSVNDNGLGIDLVKHKNNFFKIGKVFHRHPNAKGFGLYMTKTQVEAMNSKIWVESTPDIGSTFFIEFKNQKA
jgi:PAS domain S-box-containing protein